jgi:SAM-dependent methyltransferase
MLGVPDVWDAIANSYAMDVMPYFALYAEEALRIAEPGRRRTSSTSLAGRGPWHFRAPRVRGLRGIDFSPRMIEEVRARVEREGVRNLDAEVMDAQALRFADSTFDAAFCLFAFMFFPDRGRAFQELFRVLRDRGKAIVVTWAPIARRPFIKIGFEAMAEAVPQMPPLPKGELQDPEACIEEMTAAGFRDSIDRALAGGVVAVAGITFESWNARVPGSPPCERKWAKTTGRACTIASSTPSAAASRRGVPNFRRKRFFRSAFGEPPATGGEIPFEGHIDGSPVAPGTTDPLGLLEGGA